ncbi:MAG: D-amino acid aminotransferase [Candidatus Muproteobacteria bacterium RBG_16_64_11]|uniref:D-amino acid aminotransferase n=1 Tax=Candidatus Muproteobacteria bacterium RBG_16_64_11 TaxID=1817758 RepID=A0A1F6THR3_9PROT|nr:MAG: D-amino acid aminotransferase [Candidatus Muproteobacteria bacterium RBG_16_64_11]
MDFYPIKQVYLNGAFVAPEAAQVSAFDRGFVFGDGVYEVIPVYGGKAFRLPHHLQRLEASLAAIGLGNPLTHAEWSAVFAELIRANSGDVQGRTSASGGGMPGAAGDQSIYLQVTRGVAARDHAFPKDTPATVFAFSQPLKAPDAAQLASGIAAITVPDNRWQRCDIKAIALLPNVLLRQQALARGAVEAILIRDGFLTEGAASNIFVVRAGRLLTPPRGPFILPGITRDLILELAHAHGVDCREAAVSEAELLNADELWMTSSTKEILPITRLNDAPVGDGKPGPLQARFRQLYEDYKQAFRAGQAE